MQSFLQYRRFGKHVAAQYERDKSKAEAHNSPDISQSTSPASVDRNATDTAVRGEPIHAQDHFDTRDPEKGEETSGALPSIGIDEHAPLNKERTEQQNERYEPIRATPSGRHGTVADEEAEHMSKATTIVSKQTLGTALGTTLTGIDVRDRSTKEGGEGKVFVVGYEGEKDIMNPHNWSLWTRFGATWVEVAASIHSDG